MSYTKPKLKFKQKFLFAFLSALVFVVISVLLDFMLGNFAISAKSVVIQGILFGVLFGLFFPKVSNVLGKKLYYKIDDPELQENEEIKHVGPANLFEGHESVGGKLFLTNQTLIFKSHKYNIQNSQINIDLSKISEIIARRTLKIVDNGIRVQTVSGLKFDFVVNNRKEWTRELQKETGGIQGG